MPVYWYVKKVTAEGSLVEKWTSPIEQLSDRDLEQVQAALMELQCKRANEAAKTADAKDEKQ